jgi:hypothetical protein
MLLTGCMSGEKSKLIVTHRQPASTSIEKLKLIMSNRCTSCHDGNGNQGTKVDQFFIYNSNKEYIESGLIVAGSLENSILYYRLSGVSLNKGTENMPLGSSQLSAADLKTLSDWIVNMDPNLNPTEIKISSPTELNTVGPTSTLTVSGLCESDILVSFSGDITSTSTMCINDTFQKSIIFTANDGTKNIRAEQEVNTHLNFDEITVTLDTTAPSPTIVSPPAGTRNPTGITLTGSCENLVNVILTGDIENAPIQTSCNSGMYSQAVIFSTGLGNKNINVDQVDKVSLSGHTERVFEKTPPGGPVVKITAPAALSYHQQTITLAGTCESGLNIVFSGDILSLSPVLCNNNVFSNVIATFDPIDGPKTIIATQSDPGRPDGSDSRVFIKDTTNPILTVTSPSANTSFMTGLLIKGSCEGLFNISITGDVASNVNTSCSNQMYSAEVYFSSGTGNKNIIISQTDLANNTGSANRNFIALDPNSKTDRNTAATTIILNNCTNCHTGSHGSGLYNFSNLTTDNDWNSSSFVIQKDAANSKLYGRIKNSQGSIVPKNMPLDNASSIPQNITAIELATIKDWIDLMDVTAADAHLSYYAKPRFGNRQYYLMKLAMIFGVTKVNDLLANIFLNTSAFGGPCSYYANSMVDNAGSPAPANGLQHCYSGLQSASAPIIGSSTPYRSAWLINTCEVLTDDLASLSTAATIAGIVSGQVINLPNQALITSAYQQFYPDRVPSAQLVNALIAVGNTETVDYKKWQRIYLTICMSGDWAIP